MAEIVSRQAAKIAAGTKLAPHEALGKKRVVVITSPATAVWTDGSTIGSGVVLPIGTRFTLNSKASVEAFGASVVLAVGIRNPDTLVAIDADGIAVAVDIATAATKDLNNGALVDDGVEYVTTALSEVYATISGANPTDDKQIRIEVEVITPD